MNAPPTSALAMLLADARLPVGGHVSSNGLEPALRAGLPTTDVTAYMQARMETVVPVEAATAVVARAATSHARGPLSEALAEIAAEWAARTPSPALREISRHLGAGLARLAGGLWPENPSVALVRSVPRPRPIVLGVIAAVGKMDAAELVRVVMYDDAQTVAAAMLKLEPRDPVEVARWALDACAVGEPAVPALADLTDPRTIPTASAPLVESWAEAHTTTQRRLFRA